MFVRSIASTKRRREQLLSRLTGSVLTAGLLALVYMFQNFFGAERLYY